MVARIAGMRNLRRAVELRLRVVVGLLLLLLLLLPLLLLLLLLLLLVVELLLLVVQLLVPCRHLSAALGLHLTLRNAPSRRAITAAPSPIQPALAVAQLRLPPGAPLYGPRPTVAQPRHPPGAALYVPQQRSLGTLYGP